MFRLIVFPLVIGSLTSRPPAVSIYRHAQEGPSVELWTNRGHGDVLHRGDRLRVFFRTDDDAYVTVFRVDTDGRVRMLHPDEPWEDNFARARRSYEIDRRYDDYAFVVDEYPGEGYLFAIATLDPFDYSPIVRGDHWDYRAVAANGRIAGDPYAALQDLVDLIAPANYESYGYDVYEYYVERRYDYPRFLCYDCHAYAAYPYWDPYRYSCARFRIVIYDDPYYYPARVYPGTRVVYRVAPQLEPRYVFKDRSPSDAYVVRLRQRAAEPASRRPDEPGPTVEQVDRGVTGRDIGGAGTIPTPVRVPESRDPRREQVVVPRSRLDVQRQLEPAQEAVGRRTIEPERPGVGTQPERPERVPATRQPTEQPAAREAAPDRRAVPRELNPRLEPREPTSRAQPARPPASTSPKAQPRTPQREPAKQPPKPPEKKPPEKPARRPG